jgi:hypothetical protein
MWIVSSPPGPDTSEEDPQQSVGTIETRTLASGLRLENRELVTQGENLRVQVGSGSEAGANRAAEGNQDRPHTCTTVSADAAPLNCSRPFGIYDSDRVRLRLFTLVNV